MHTNPKCCLGFNTFNDEKQQLCSNSGNCEYEILMMIKKIKLTCDGMPLEPIKESMGIMSLVEYAKIPLSSVQPYYIIPK